MHLQDINKTIYYRKAVCVYIALEDTIDLLNFGDSFDGSLDNASDKKPFTLTTPDVHLLENPYLPWNLFATQHIDQNIDLNTDSIADFNAIQSSIFPESDIDNLQLYPRTKHVNTFFLSASTPGFNKIRTGIKSKFLLNPKLWQDNMVADITQAKKDIVVIAGTSASKSLLYQCIPIITGGIVLVVLPTIALMEDLVSCLFISVSHVSFAKSVAKCNYLLGLNIIAVALTATTIESNPQVLKRVDRGDYSVVFASPKILLGI